MNEENMIEETLIAEETATPASNVKKMKRVTIISGCVAALAVLALVLTMLISSGVMGVPSLFRPNDINKKNAYTVSDKKALSNADVVVARLGDAELTNAGLQVFYQMQLIEFLNTYGSYTTYLGIDTKKPLSEQACPLYDGYTWEQYFLEAALDEWKYIQALASAAKKHNYELDNTSLAQIASQIRSLEQTSEKEKFDSLDAMLSKQLGVTVNTEVYRKHLTTYLIGNMFIADTVDPTVEELDAFFKENKETMEANGIKQDGSYTVNVRHILFTCDGTQNADGTITWKFPQSAEEVRGKAQALLDEWLEDPTEDNFANLAYLNTADYNGEDGGLYTSVRQGQMVKPFNDWCFDESRKPGDYGIVETQYGFHLMYFSNRNGESWIEACRSFFMEHKAMSLVDDVEEANEYVVYFNKIALAQGNLY